ncbi:MAG: translation elongation factor Ts [Phycisphaeraceae bacterium]|nr:translation elongation factor Ts [Phycisphaeraceae bacterium]
MSISAKDVMALRQRTGLGMMECKKALSDTDGDVDAAIKLLREQLGSKMQERSGREAMEGAVAAARRDGAVSLVQLVSETDFAARNDGFVAAAQKIAELALDGPDGEHTEGTAAMNDLVEGLRITIKENITLRRFVKLSAPKVGSYVHHNRKLGAIIGAEGDLSDDLLMGLCQHVTAAVPPLMPAPEAIDADGLDPAKVEAARAEFTQEAADSGKPPQIVEKIVEGKLSKWKDERVLMGQVYVRELDARKPVRDYIPKGARVTHMLRYSLTD